MFIKLNDVQESVISLKSLVIFSKGRVDKGVILELTFAYTTGVNYLFYSNTEERDKDYHTLKNSVRLEN